MKYDSWIEVKSSMINKLFFDETDSSLTIEFKDGTQYCYFDVPKGTVTRMVKSKSVGKYFWRNIRDNYEYLHKDA